MYTALDISLALWMQLGVEETRNYEFGHNR
jgi:hypothetical protein